ncbi:MAG: hypothetical protein A2X23_12625 [Chloroflexi bacterium GWC2_73_18]|nr:MAG: hypothetical protein A2X23_12625 [Chloroflexi bacterium GWC2_73_18]
MSGTLGSTTHQYTDDADGNRLTSLSGGVTTYYTYDRGDQLKTRKGGQRPDHQLRLRRARQPDR